MNQTEIDRVEQAIISRVESLFSSFPTWSRQPCAEYSVVRSIGQIVQEEFRELSVDQRKKVAHSSKSADNIKTIR